MKSGKEFAPEKCIGRQALLSPVSARMDKLFFFSSSFGEMFLCLNHDLMNGGPIGESRRQWEDAGWFCGLGVVRFSAVHICDGEKKES